MVSLENLGAGVLLEATDKRFFLCAHAVECLLFSRSNQVKAGPQIQSLKNQLAERLAEYFYSETMAHFCRASQSREKDDVLLTPSSMNTWLKGLERDDTILVMQAVADKTWNELTGRDSESPSIDHYLPSPDKARSGKSVGGLPHVSSIAHIYARINHVSEGNLSKVTLHHDEQVQFEPALLETIASIDCGIDALFYDPSVANYRISVPAMVQFEASHEGLALQVADVVAGALAYCVQALSAPHSSISNQWQNVLNMLMRQNELRSGTGVNMVVPTPLFERIVSVGYENTRRA